MNKEIYKKLLYYVWCKHCERESFEYISTHEEFEEFLKSTDEHFGDCTKDACTCSRCVLQTCEVEATRLYKYLFLDKYHGEKYNFEEKEKEIEWT